MRSTVVLAAALLAACGGSGAPAARSTPVASSSEALRAFMQAAADSNLTRMAQLWGTSRGSAIETGSPSDYEKRLIVMQSYLRGDSAHVVSDTPVTGDANRRHLAIALYRQGCAKQIPATMVRTKAGGWVVNSVDLTSAGNPARPCEPGGGGSADR
jgi:hypothetical protein